MKALIIILVFVLSLSNVNAQSGFSCNFTSTSDSCEQNCTVTLLGTCTNNDCCNSINITQSIVTSNLPTGWSITMCNPNGCFSSADVSNTFILGASSKGSVKFQINAGSNLGTGTATVRFENQVNSSDFTEFTVTGIAKGTSTTAVIEVSKKSSSGLSQNYPNPFIESTYIDYTFTTATGTLKIVDITGKMVKAYSLNQKSGQLQISENLKPGTYFYSLWDGNNSIVSNKKMIVSK
ncbi:MAG: hypothetical protein COC01_03725 [Bacteroidetes bacterium]|nr:MAG: hypothetical protein COC01_03725 [Bacteroidota bacterium]